MTAPNDLFRIQAQTMTLLEYMARSFLGDLRKFRSCHPGDTIPYLAGEVLERHCGALNIAPVNFVSLAYLDSVLLAAVCTYDHRNFAAYLATTHFYQHLGQIGGLQGRRLPQKMLRGLGWSAEDCAIVSCGISDLPPDWAREYGRRLPADGGGLKKCRNLAL